MRNPTFARSRAFTLLTAVTLAGQTLVANAQLEEVIVVAQKRAESAQDVPIAITAFDEDAMRDRQIVGFADMRFSAPNVGYNKGNFTGNNFQIRGVGTNLVAASADSGVGIHVNEVFIVSPRLFETEYYDIEQVEILRGPQGTLYGRNSTGGAVNMITRTADPFGELSGNFEAQYGNYDHKKIVGAVNVPISDTFAVRAAGIWLDREGYTENIVTGNDVDGRDQYSGRLSLRWLPSDSTEIDLMLSYFEEDSSRSRSQKTMCNNDPTGILGCIPDRLEFDVPNPSSQLANLLVSDALIGGLAGDPALGSALSLFQLGSNERGTIPADIRKVASEQDPIYESDETLATLTIKQRLGEEHLLTFVGGYQDTSVLSQMDYQWTVGPQVAVPALFQALAPNTTQALYADGLFPMSAPHPSNNGVIGGHVQSRLGTLETYDQSNQASEQWSGELRLQSDYDGPFNFLAGGFWMDVDLDNDYFVLSNAFDYFATLVPALNGLDGAGWVAPHFNNATPAYNIRSSALFGELYYQLTDDIKLTVGARYTVDEKTITDRQFLFNEDVETGVPGFVPIGPGGPVPGAVRRDETREWREWTGRVVLDWAINDSSMAYASFSRGYKGGGFNPPFDPVDFPSQEPEFEPEFVDAYEVGIKNTLFNNTLQANLTAFWYDYTDMQVSKIVNRTSFNENTDATIWGFEGEFLFAPTANWLFNANFAYLNTEVKDFATIDTRDPTNGLYDVATATGDVTLVKDIGTASNCVALLDTATFAAVAGSQFSDCNALAAAGLPITDGIAQDLSGNQLQNAPEMTVSLGAQYNWLMNGGAELNLRVDYYWQDEMYSRFFNKPIDRIDSWDIWNAQATFTSAENRWYARAYVKNLMDDDNLVAMYITDPSSGMFTNVFAIEPRTYGVAVGYNF